MYREVVIEALSALVGAPVTLLSKSEKSHSPDDDLLTVGTLLKDVYFREIGKQAIRTISQATSKVGGSENSAIRKELMIDEDEFFDPVYDFDFTYMTDSSACTRGGETYKRPIGWNRIALKVRGKYPDGNTWMGAGGWRDESSKGEWPVSFHGTSFEGARSIIRDGYKAGDGAAYGRGIYSTPNVGTANAYAKEFTSKTNGKTYKVVLQNRINPKYREICPCDSSEYWLVPVPKGTSPEGERSIVDQAIRPYGLLLKEVKGNTVLSP